MAQYPAGIRGGPDTRSKAGSSAKLVSHKKVTRPVKERRSDTYLRSHMHIKAYKSIRKL